mmetsp:Transcript_26419/g.61625  ORF Transcript_26419/g.61625 Transcript_26419/m.61625 type:complete len:254 (+) Transcript_26419:138-899(+)
MHPAGSENILCKDGGGESPCELDAMLRCWEKVDPTKCHRAPGLLFLWDVWDSMNADPTGGLADDPLCGGAGLPSCTQWAAKTWMDYVDKWRPKLAVARRRGLVATSPRFHGDPFAKLAAFFAACPECNQEGSPYYIGALAFNGGLSQVDLRGSAAHIKGVAAKLKQIYPGRPVVLANTGSFGARNPADLADMIDNSGLFDKIGNPLDAVYWLVYPQQFSGRFARSVLHDKVQSGPQIGKMLGQVLVEKCGPQR